jgi:CRISPR-associated helicase Cas3
LRLRPGVEALLEEAAREAIRGGSVFFEAPTGYGKTRAGPLLYERLASSGCSTRLIHALPLRAIVEEAYAAYRESLPHASIGYQAHGLGLPGKAPFFASDAIVTTMDSLAFNLLRSSVGERGLGHYEVPRAHIIASTVVLDEAHLPLADPSGPATGLLAVAEVLHRLSVPVVVETATLPPAVAGVLAKRLGSVGEPVWVSVEPQGGWSEPPGPRGLVSPRRVEDPSYYEWALSLKWRYTAVREPEEALRLAVEAAESGLRVFYASSTVVGAVEAYQEIIEEYDGLRGHVALVHGRLASVEREKVREAVANSLIVVGTSAVEAGVNIDSDVVVTDAPRDTGGISWESLLQRLGRACRDPGRACTAVDVILYGDNAGEALEALTKPRPLNPRIPYPLRGEDGYVDRLLSKRSYRHLDLAWRRFSSLVELGLEALTHERIRAIYDAVCTPFREAPLVPLIIPPGDWGYGGTSNLDALVERLQAGWYLTVSAEDLVSGDSWSERGRRWLYIKNERALALIARVTRDDYGHPDNLVVEPLWLPPKELDCRRLARRPILGLVARPGAYRAGVGLV